MNNYHDNHIELIKNYKEKEEDNSQKLKGDTLFDDKPILNKDTL